MRRPRPESAFPVRLAAVLLGLALAPLADAKTTDRTAEMKIEADRAVIHRRAGEITQIELIGTPATLKQVADNGEPMNARATRIVYTLNEDQVVLTGAVAIEQTRGTLRGETIKYDLKTGRLDGGGDGNRVQMRILPKSATPAPPPAAPASSN